MQAITCTDENYVVTLPLRGKVYTVRAIDKFIAGTGILLEEINNKPYQFFTEGLNEPYFPIDVFRELQPPIANIEKQINENTLEPVLK